MSQRLKSLTGLRNLLILLLLVLCLFSGNSFASEVNDDALQVKTVISGQEFNSVDGINLNIRLTLTNNSPANMLIYKRFFAVSRIVMSDSLINLEKGKYISDNQCHVNGHAVRLDLPTPPPDLFVSLNPGSEYEKQISTFFMSNWNSIQPGRAYYILFVVETWAEQFRLGQKLKNKWKNFGRLRLEPIVTQPLQISFSPEILKPLQDKKTKVAN